MYGQSIKTVFETISSDAGHWTEEANGIRGICSGWGSAVLIAPEAENACLTAKIIIKKGARAGYALRCAISDGLTRGGTVLLDIENQRVELAELYYLPREGFGRLCNDVVNGGLIRDGDYKRMPLEYEREYALRVLMNHEFFEIYLDDIWIIIKALKNAAPIGSVQAIVERGDAWFTHDLRFMKNKL